jgi:hypothetical protein
MKMKFFPPFRDEGQVVAPSGEAELIKFLDGRIELRGGSEQDRAEAREWLSLFGDEAMGELGGYEIVVDSGRQILKVGGCSC